MDGIDERQTDEWVKEQMREEVTEGWLMDEQDGQVSPRILP